VTQAFKSALAGYTATKLMTSYMYDIAPMIHLPPVDVAGAINTTGKKDNGNESEQFDAKKEKKNKQPGMFVHYLLGTIIFPLSYGTFFRHLLPGGRIAKGILWGAGLWAAGQSFVLPGLGKKPYFERKPMAKLTYFFAHMVYGIAFCAGSESNILKTRKRKGL
jgi:hypothetical protein